MASLDAKLREEVHSKFRTAVARALRFLNADSGPEAAIEIANDANLAADKALERFMSEVPLT